MNLMINNNIAVEKIVNEKYIKYFFLFDISVHLSIQP
jgi:hypothetical protein